jgi:tetratricopeptide (TPR) repeat protein
MRKIFFSLMFVGGMIAAANAAWADDEPKKPESTPAAEGKASDEPKQEAAKDEEQEDEKPEDPLKEGLKNQISQQRVMRHRRTIDQAVIKEDWDKALAGLDKIIDDKEILKEYRIQAMRDKFEILAKEKLDGTKACALAKKIGQISKDDPTLLNDLAWAILDTEGLKNRDLDVALSLCLKANEMSQGQSGAILDTLGRAYFEKEDFDKAVEYQTLAVEKMKSETSYYYDDSKENIAASLEKYKAKQAEKKGEKKATGGQ